MVERVRIGVRHETCVYVLVHVCASHADEMKTVGV